MAISDVICGNIKIGTKMYTEPGVMCYMEEHREGIKPQNVIQKLRTMQRANATCEVLNENYIVFQEDSSPNAGGMLYIGNALAVALWCKEYELAEGLAKSGVMLENGQSAAVLQNTEGEFDMGERINDSVMETVLNKENIPETVWYALWENYASLDFKRSRNRFLPNVELKKIYKWIENLSVLKEKRPDLWEQVASDEFKCGLLWVAAGNKQIMSKQNLMRFCKALKTAELIPEEQTVFWKEIIFRQNKEYEKVMHFPTFYAHTENYFCLWKVLTGQPIVLDWNGSECNELTLRKSLELDCERSAICNRDNLEWWLKHVDIVINSELECSETVISYGLQDERRLLIALKSNLLPQAILPMAISRARTSTKTLIPLLILKQHGEFDYNWEEG